MTEDELTNIEWARQREALFAKEAAELELERKRVLTELNGRLWHTTHPDRFTSILTSHAILPEPSIPDGERSFTGGGKEHYPYVRTLGGVSLFDFDQFDPETYLDKCPGCTWAEFVPYRIKWGCSVWIEIDRAQVAPRLISGLDLVAKQWSDEALGHMIMPYIEAAYLGPLPRTAFKRAFLVRKDDSQFHPLEC